MQTSTTPTLIRFANTTSQRRRRTGFRLDRVKYRPTSSFVGFVCSGYGQIVEFLTALAEHVTDYRLESECASSRQAIKDAMLKALWEMHELSDCMDHHQEWGELSLVLRGTPGHYLGKVAAEQNRRAQELPA